MALTRRQFLLGTVGAGAAGAAGVVVTRRPWELLGGGGGTGATGPGTSPTAGGPLPAIAGKDGILVLVTLYGGNDGLNTVIPYEAGQYLGGRRELGHRPEEVLPLGEGLAFHPNLKGLKELWDQKRLAIVRGVGYPNPSRSHFRSMDIWQSGNPESSVATGWLGRWLDGTGTDPLRAVSVGSTLPRILAGERAAGAAVPIGPLTLPGGTTVATGFAVLSTPSAEGSPLGNRVAQTGADLLQVDRQVADMLASQPADPDAGAAAGLDGERAAGGGGRYGAGSLASQLDLVARMVRAGAPTRAYSVSLGGFDTHANEKDVHARLMTQLDGAVAGFVKDMAGHPDGQRVVVVAYSEFGRRVAANASGGTDHGTAAPVFVAGSRVKGGFYGDEPSLTTLDDGDLRFTTDFRAVYSTLLHEVVGVDATASLGRAFPPVGFL